MLVAQHDVTGYAPAFLVFARNVPISGDYYARVADNSTNKADISDKLQMLNDIRHYRFYMKRFGNGYTRHMSEILIIIT